MATTIIVILTIQSKLTSKTSFNVLISACRLALSFHHIPGMLCRFSSAVYGQILRTMYPMVPYSLQAVIPVLTPPTETPPFSPSVVQKANSVKCVTQQYLLTGHKFKKHQDHPN